MSSPISNVFHPTLVDQTDRDPHRQRDDAARHHGSRPHPPHPHSESPATVEALPSAEEHRTIGLLLDVTA